MTSPRVRSILAAFAALGVALAAVAAGAETDVYRPRHRIAGELLPLAQAAAGDDARVVLDPVSNAIVVVGSPPALARVRAILEEMDRALRSVIIQYRQQGRAELDAAGVEIRWGAGDGPVRIGNAVGDGIDVRVGSRASDQSAERSGTLRVLEGHTGRMETGSRIPYQTGFGGNRSTSFVEVSSGFEVTPRILGDGRVRLELRPYGAQPAADGSIAYSAAATTLVVRPGETVVVGGIVRGGEARALGTRGSATARGQDSEVLLVSVETE